jgi:hypothetical protein
MDRPSSTAERHVTNIFTFAQSERNVTILKIIPPPKKVDELGDKNYDRFHIQKK